MEPYRTVSFIIVSAEISEVSMDRSDIGVYAEAYMDDNPGEKRFTREERGPNPKWGTTMRFEVRENMLRRNQLIIKLRRRRSLLPDKTIGKVRLIRSELVGNLEENHIYGDVYMRRLLSSRRIPGGRLLIVSFRLEEVCYRRVPNKVLKFVKGLFGSG